MTDLGEWHITGVDPDVARIFLQKYAPWRMALDFDGVSSADFGAYQPYNPVPLRKLKETLKVVPLGDVRGSRVLDVGFNVGYNTLYLAQEFGAHVTGIDVVQRHREATNDLASMLQVSPELLLESAETFERPEAFNLILHFGTLYHLANPVISIDRCIRSLKGGGWFALETMCYRAADNPAACEWIYGLNGDKTNFWSLGEDAIRSIVRRSGITLFEIVFEAWPPAYERRHSRTIWIGRKEQ
jgi:SAM-dependent methyltransferase